MAAQQRHYPQLNYSPGSIYKKLEQVASGASSANFLQFCVIRYLPTAIISRMPATYTDPEFIHRGGFGIVERVFDAQGAGWARKTFDAPVNIKADAQALAKARRRFHREIAVQASLTHPHIMPIVDHALDDTPPWYIMPLADEDYDAQIERDRVGGTVSLDPLLDILAGLEEMHRLGYVHRDMKPGNVLKFGDKWVISDFGFVLPQSRDTTVLTATHSAWGTRGYAAPELATGFSAAPPQCDIYAIGCMLHDLVSSTPRVPFSQAHAPGHPLNHIIEKCTEVDPDDRFPDIASMRNALVGALTVAPTVAASLDVQQWVMRLESAPDQIDETTWKGIAHFLDRETDSSDAHTLLLAVDLPQLEALQAGAPRVFPRIALRLARWARDGSFDFAYCDVVGARLVRIFDLGGVRERAEATMAAFNLGYSHNRWSVMRQFMRMASPTIEDDLADRIAVEMYTLGWDATYKFARIESAISVSAGSLHPKIKEALERIREQFKKQVDDTTDLIF